MWMVLDICSSLLLMLTISDAAVNYPYTKSLITVIQGQTATFVWTANLGAGRSWARIEINRDTKTLIDDNTKQRLVEYLKAKGQPDMLLANRKADMTLTVDTPAADTINITFTLKNIVRKTDDMNYLVRVINDYGQTKDSYTKLNVNILPGTPNVQVHPNKQVFCVLNTVNITCNATVGYPTNTNLTLYRNNHIIKTVQVPRTENDKETNTTIEIPLTSGVNSFSCKAENSAGLSEKRGTLNITAKGKPRIFNCSNSLAFESTSLIWNCDAIGSPEMKYAWYRGGKIVSIQKSLRINNVNRTDAGMYNFTVSEGDKECLTASTTVYLTVQYFQGCKEKVLEVTIGGLAGQCVSVPRKGNPVPTLSCLPGENLDITQKDGEYSLCGVKGDTVSNCTIANGVGRCSFLVKSYQQIDEYVYKGRFTCSSCNYDKGLDDSSSAVFKTTKKKMEKMLKSVYEVHKHVTSIEVIHFRKGSVIVVFQLHLVANVSNPLSPLKEALIKNAGSLNGLTIDPFSIQQGDDTPSNCQSASSITPCTERSQVPALVLGVILGVSLIVNFIFIGYFVWKHMKENKERPNGRKHNNDDSGYANAIALQEQPPSDSQDVVQYATVGNEREQESPNTTVYQSIKPHSDTYSSLSPSTKLPPKPAVITNSGDYQDLQGAPRHYQSLDNFSRV